MAALGHPPRAHGPQSVFASDVPLPTDRIRARDGFADSCSGTRRTHHAGPDTCHDREATARLM